MAMMKATAIALLLAASAQAAQPRPRRAGVGAVSSNPTKTPPAASETPAVPGKVCKVEDAHQDLDVIEHCGEKVATMTCDCKKGVWVCMSVGLVAECTCEGGREWKECGSPCGETLCFGSPPACMEMCEARCQCPDSTPIWDPEAKKCARSDDQCTPKPAPAPTAGDECNKDSAHFPTYEQQTEHCGEMVPTLSCRCDAGSWLCNTVRLAGDCESTCTGGQKWNDCASSCKTVCGEEPPAFCNEMCNARCDCPTQAPIWDAVAEQCVATNDECSVAPAEGQCTGGQKWNDCASSCKTVCGEEPPAFCNKMCSARCDCPTKAPIWDAVAAQCVATNDECSVAPAGGGGQCTGGQKWNDCASSCKTVCGEEPPAFCNKMCSARCDCPTKAPIWDAVAAQCVATNDECAVEKPVTTWFESLARSGNSVSSNGETSEGVVPALVSYVAGLLAAAGQTKDKDEAELEALVESILGDVDVDLEAVLASATGFSDAADLLMKDESVQTLIEESGIDVTAVASHVRTLQETATDGDNDDDGAAGLAGAAFRAAAALAAVALL